MLCPSRFPPGLVRLVPPLLPHHRRSRTGGRRQVRRVILLRSSSGVGDTPHPIGPYPPLGSAVVIGRGFSPIQYKLVASITSGAIIDLATLRRAASDEPTMPTISIGGHLVLPAFVSTQPPVPRHNSVPGSRPLFSTPS